MAAGGFGARSEALRQAVRWRDLAECGAGTGKREAGRVCGVAVAGLRSTGRLVVKC